MGVFVNSDCFPSTGITGSDFIHFGSLFACVYNKLYVEYSILEKDFHLLSVYPITVGNSVILNRQTNVPLCTYTVLYMHTAFKQMRITSVHSCILVYKAYFWYLCILTFH